MLPAPPVRRRPLRPLRAAAVGAVLLALAGAGRASGDRWPVGRAAPSVTADAEATPQGVKIALRGSGWPARASLALRVSAPPGTRDPLDLGTAVANAAGDFRATKLTRCSTSDPAGGRQSLTVTVRTADGTASAETTLSAAPWVCPAP
jgi:hypothetical protein